MSHPSAGSKPNRPNNAVLANDGMDFPVHLGWRVMPDGLLMSECSRHPPKGARTRSP
jgi:hypothetical protein